METPTLTVFPPAAAAAVAAAASVAAAVAAVLAELQPTRDSSIAPDASVARSFFIILSPPYTFCMYTLTF